MNEFVEQCRAEWRRLGVADPLAEEMAADLTSDLEEAEAEGVTVAEYLGRSASDPRSFAASWAAERGIIPAPAGRKKDRRTPFALVAFTAFAAIAVLVAVLLLATGEPKVSLTARRTGSHLPSRPEGPSTPSITVHRVQASAAAPIEWILLVVAIAALGFAAWMWWRWGRSHLGLAGVVGVTVLAAAMLAAGCGAGTSIVPNIGRAAVFGRAVAFAQCMRTHGEPNFPDPVHTRNSVHETLAARSGIDPNSPQFTAAHDACKHVLPNNGVPAPSPGQTLTLAERADYLKAAACMRSRGVPGFPDPTFVGDDVTFRSRTRIDTSTPQYNSALTTCRRLIPPGLPYSSSSSGP